MAAAIGPKCPRSPTITLKVFSVLFNNNPSEFLHHFITENEARIHQDARETKK